jgi:signal transduction histidine kinase
MKADIRTRLMIQFTLIVSVILFLLCSIIYWFSANYRLSVFYSRLENKAITTARLLLDVKEVDSLLLRIIDQKSEQQLYNEVVTVFDYQNRKVYCNIEGDTLHVNKNILDRIRLEKYIRLRKGKQEVLGLLFAEKHLRYVVIASAFDLYGRSKLNYLLWILIIGFVFCILITFITGRFFAVRALKPIADMVTQVEKISFENLAMRLNEGNRRDEIDLLAMTFNKMLDRLNSAVDMQKSFISNASHELRTPLTSITGQIEVALMKSRSAGEYQSILSSVLEDTRNLNSLANGLLYMAKASSDPSSIALRPVRIDEILWEAHAEMASRKPDYRISIHFGETIEDDKELIVNGNPMLLKSAVLNLLENGCKFSDHHSMEVCLSTSRKQMTLKFTDEGIGISGDEVEKILQPFYRAGNVRNIPGSGLGLSLACMIIRLHRGDLSIDSLPGKGTTITVTLPGIG